MDQIQQFEQGLQPFKNSAHQHADHHVMNRISLPKIKRYNQPALI